jgi:hypothetical protein
LYSKAKGKKAQMMAAFTNLVTTRANQPGSSQILPIVTTQLFNQLAHFELGSSDLSIITNGISPFLMCPRGYGKAMQAQKLSREYQMIYNGTGTPSLTDIQRIITDDYNLPDNLYQLVDFIGAYSVIWDVLTGPTSSVSLAVSSHYQYWHRQVSAIQSELPQPQLQGHVITGTLRAMQLEILGYVTKRMGSDDVLDPPSLAHIQETIDRGLYALPALPARYYIPTVPPNTSVVTSTKPVAPGNSTAPLQTSGTQQPIPEDQKVTGWIATFEASEKSINQLKALPVVKRPKADNGGFICLAYHLRGVCFDNCRHKDTHRTLTSKEQKAVQKLVDTEL